MGEIDRGHRPQLRYYGGDRNLEIVSGKVYSANQPYIARSLPPPLPPRSPDPPAYWSKYDLDNDRRVGKPARGGGGGSAWCFGDPEMKRRKRVASYKAYSVEGKMKAKIQRGMRWIKVRCRELFQGY